MLKTSRESEIFTSWHKIDQEYKGALLRFIDSSMDDSRDNMFLKDFTELQKKIAYYGTLNFLLQLLLKIPISGIPDFYKRTELCSRCKTPWQTFLDSKKLADGKMLDRLQPIGNTVREVSSAR
jgi:maltooligosyltrehalose synthase